MTELRIESMSSPESKSGKGKNKRNNTPKNHNNGSSSTDGGLVWNDLSVRTQNGTFLVQNCHGMIPNGHLCGLLGPSGAGKVRCKWMRSMR
jgi:ABC-type uncharacterized transport system fused permease/ATPase subunit